VRAASGQGPRAGVANENYLARTRFIFAPARRSARHKKGDQISRSPTRVILTARNFLSPQAD
jgi:hypothetical protein